MLHLALAFALLGSARGLDEPTCIGTYTIHLSEENRALYKSLGTPEPVVRYVLRKDHTYKLSKVTEGHPTEALGTYSEDDHDLSFTPRDDSQQTFKGRWDKDHLILGTLVFDRISSDVAGLWVKSTDSGVDRSIRFRFNDKGRFWFVQGDQHPKGGFPPINSQGTYRVEDGRLLLTYEKIDGDDVSGLPPGKLTLSDARDFLLDANGARFERAVEDKK